LTAWNSENDFEIFTRVRGRSGPVAMAAGQSHRNQSLDALRCIAILLVIGFHLNFYSLWGRAGWIGVDLFFVLSGFLISGLLFQEYKNKGKIDIKRFLIRRGLKIYPSFYLLIAAAAILSFVKHSPQLRTQVIFSSIFAQNYYNGKAFTVLAHTWSLAVEEHFYLMLPFLLLLLITLKRSEPFRPIPGIFVFVALNCLAFRCFSLSAGHEARATHLRLDSLFAGVAVGYIYHYEPRLFQKLSRGYSLLFAIILCSPAILLDHRNRLMQTIGLTSLLFGFSLLVIWSVSRTPRSAIGRLVVGGAARIGFYSYSIYLWHTVVAEFYLSRFALSALNFWVCLAATVAMGVVMGRLVEAPYLALREKIAPSSHADLSVPLLTLRHATTGTAQQTEGNRIA
jgi:peptidoglycan/LPS O-acetylase OafA/YrhL